MAGYRPANKKINYLTITHMGLQESTRLPGDRARSRGRRLNGNSMLRTEMATIKKLQFGEERKSKQIVAGRAAKVHAKLKLITFELTIMY